ncbi:MAG: hypothetical protein CSA23_01980 [Deltaproteobacteria bacterium]|nr:MAG: hypothetical protein CSA23_01980 [Deltaproteobacteria bacterium]
MIIVPVRDSIEIVRSKSYPGPAGRPAPGDVISVFFGCPQTVGLASGQDRNEVAFAGAVFDRLNAPAERERRPGPEMPFAGNTR